MKKPIMALTIGLVITGCSNSEMINNKSHDVSAAVPVEEKLIDSEVIENPAENGAEKEAVKPSTSTDNNNGETAGNNGETVSPEKEVIDVVANPDDLLVLVNKQHNLSEDYAPSDLVAPNIPFYFDEDVPKRYVRREAANALEELFTAAKEDNIELLGASGYRSYSRQEAIFASNVAQKGEEEARKVSAEAGQSEHQTGLAMDVTSKYVSFDLSEEFGETKEGIWLKDNAYKYGFIIRYPKGKEAITGYSYEPWHIRFVGKAVAAIIYQNGYTLEEYFLNK